MAAAPSHFFFLLRNCCCLSLLRHYRTATGFWRAPGQAGNGAWLSASLPSIQGHARARLYHTPRSYKVTSSPYTERLFLTDGWKKSFLLLSIRETNERKKKRRMEMKRKKKKNRTIRELCGSSPCGWITFRHSSRGDNKLQSGGERKKRDNRKAKEKVFSNDSYRLLVDIQRVRHLEGWVTALAVQQHRHLFLVLTCTDGARLGHSHRHGTAAAAHCLHGVIRTLTTNNSLTYWLEQLPIFSLSKP